MTLRKLCGAAVLLGALAAGLGAQNVYFPYYGKNRIVYEKFPWRTYKTEHFEIYFYEDSLERLKLLAELCESAYQQISDRLRHELTKPVPLLFYTTYTDFEQSNLFDVSEGLLGVSEPVLHRIGLHGDMSVDALQELIIHELTHVFQFDILWGSQGGALYALSAPPLWTFEGLSEYNTQNWSTWSSLIVRDAVLNDRIPDFTEAGELSSRYLLPREPAYDFGHAIYDYLVQQYGANAIQELWLSLKGYSLLARRDPFKRAFNVKIREFAQSFKRYLRESVKPFLARENPEDYSFALGPEFPMNPYYFSFSHALSPSGDIAATITYSARDEDLDIVLINVGDGTVLKNITRGYTTKYEYIKYDIDPSLGRMLAWSPDGNSLAFFGRDGRRYSLYLIDAFSGHTLQRVKLTVDRPSCPSFTPDSRSVLFTAFSTGLHDIFRVDLATSALTNLTQDDLFEKAPCVSPDGKSVAYSVRLGTEDRLFLSPLDDLSQRKQLTFGPGSAITPQFASDGTTLYFSGDKEEAFNIYALSLETGELRRFTNVRTGNFFPQPLPDEPGRIIFAAFNKSSFQLFKASPQATPEGTLPFTAMDSTSGLVRFEPRVRVDVDKTKVLPYKGIGKLYISERPPVDVTVSTDGSIYGGSAIAFGDLMGDHSFTVLAYQVRSFRSYYFSYLNQVRRLQFAVNAFQFTQFYYPSLYYTDPVFWNFTTYRDAIAQRQIMGLSLDAYYPFNRYYRAQASVGYYHFEEDYLDPTYLMQGPMQGRSLGFLNGEMLQASFSLVGETTRFKYYGPGQGHTFALSVVQAIPAGRSFLRNTTLEADLRKYLYLGADFVVAFRLKAFGSWGREPFYNYVGGNNEVRSVYYYSLFGTETWFFNAELRVPLLSSLQTVIGNFGPVRGTVFFDLAQRKIKGFPSKFYVYYDMLGLRYDEFEAIGSFGYGFQMFFLGLPIHVEFVKRLYFPRLTNPFDTRAVGGFQTNFWIGFDF